MYRARRLPRDVATSPFPWASTVPASAADLHVSRTTRDPASDGANAGATRRAEVEREAFGKGYQQGERAGLEAGGRRAEAMLRRMAETLEELGGLRQSMIRETEQQMVQLALAIAKRIIRREVTIDHDMTLAMARVALDRLSEHTGATIRLHPDDYALALGESGESWGGDQVTMVADERVSRGGCHIESAFGFIDAGVDAQFDEIASAALAEEPAHAVARVDHEMGKAVTAE